MHVQIRKSREIVFKGRAAFEVGFNPYRDRFINLRPDSDDILLHGREVAGDIEVGVFLQYISHVRGLLSGHNVNLNGCYCLVNRFDQEYEKRRRILRR